MLAYNNLTTFYGQDLLDHKSVIDSLADQKYSGKAFLSYLLYYNSLTMSSNRNQVSQADMPMYYHCYLSAF